METYASKVRFVSFILLMILIVKAASSTGLMRKRANCQGNSTQDAPISPYIVGGNVAGRHEFPWIVNIRLESQNTPHCSGSLIDWNLVVTAAHCLIYPDSLQLMDKSHLILTAGDFNTSCIDDWQQFGNPESILIHPLYQSSPVLHDIALIKLKRRFNKTIAVQPISLPSYNILEYAQEGTVIGWGLTERKSISEVLLKANINIEKSFNCTVNDKQSQFCAGGNNTDSCEGDSGGPLMCLITPQVLCGIVSFGPPNCGTAPGTYTNVLFYIDWIWKNRGLEPCTNSLLKWWQYSIIISLMILSCLLVVYVGYTYRRKLQSDESARLIHNNGHITG